jgi:hypothetical protein
MINKIIYFVCILASAVFLYSGCKDLGTNPPAIQQTVKDDSVRFSSYVHPTLQANCSCHNGSTTSGFNVSTYSNLRAGGVQFNTAVIIPNDTINSVLIQKLKGTAGTRMPAGGPFLADTTISKIGIWIMQGAHNN